MERCGNVVLKSKIVENVFDVDKLMNILLELPVIAEIFQR